MDRLRACVVASFYAKSFTKSGAKGPGPGASQHPAIQVLCPCVFTSLDCSFGLLELPKNAFC